MGNVGNILLDNEILLESGTNELEVLVFKLADFTFGINVAKVREVLPATRITELPRAHESIMGVFKLRDRVIPCVSLTKHLGVESSHTEGESTMILTDFNQQQTAFLVDEVERIHRLSWETVLSVPGLAAFSNTPVTAVTRCDNRLIVMLDFEMIIDQVTDSYFNLDAVENPHALPRDQLTVLLADDSATVREAVSTTLRNSGYTNLHLFENGAEAWKEINRRFDISGRVEDVADLLISDVEMPQIDGFHLTKRIKEHPVLKRLPVLLYSSIVTPDNHKKGQAVGADAQVSKPELFKVVGLADDLIRAARTDDDASRTDTARPESAPAAASKPSPSPTIAAAPANTSSPPDSPAPSKTETPPVAPSLPPASNKPLDEVPAASAPSTPPNKQPETPAAPVAEAPAKPPVAPAKPPTAEPQSAAQTPSATLPAPAESPSVTQISEIDPHLWRTFHQELRERVPVIQEIIAQVDQGTMNDSLLNDTLRLLHTIKSAAMVVPINEITRVTHQVESMLEGIRGTSAEWPIDGLRMYGDWLGDLAANQHDPQETLSWGPELERRFADPVSA